MLTALDIVPSDGLGLAVALAIGLLLGFERGWQGRADGEGDRVAGIRTFTLLALAGAMAARLTEGGFPALSLIFLGVAVLMAAAQREKVRDTGDSGVTTMVAGLLAFLLGALAMRGPTGLAAGTAVIAAFLLGMKTELHRFVERIRREELLATLRLLLISVVLLPLLPDEGYGPWQALNPFRIWLLVVIIAAISWAGHVAIRLVGTRRGLIVTGLFGGLASSTAVAIHLGRRGRDRPALHATLAAGILAASGMMFPRMLAVTAVVAPAIALDLAPAFLVAGLIALAAALLLARRGREPEAPAEDDGPTRNPLDLATALRFGALLAAIMLAARGLVAWFGDRGLYALAAFSGLADVDAVTLSIAGMATRGETTAGTAVLAILIAAAVNSLVKPVLVALGGGLRLATMVAAPLTLALAVAGLVALGL